jgi:hypothetical protein
MLRKYRFVEKSKAHKPIEVWENIERKKLVVSPRSPWEPVGCWAGRCASISENREAREAREASRRHPSSIGDIPSHPRRVKVVKPWTLWAPWKVREARNGSQRSSDVERMLS